MRLVAPVVLAFLAAFVLLRQTHADLRILGVRPPLRVARTRPQPGQLALLSWATGAGLWLLVGGPPGMALGVAVGLAGPRALPRVLADAAAAEEERGIATVLPLALDLLAGCLQGGAPVALAVGAVASAVPGACGDRLAQVAASLALGAPAAQAWEALGAQGSAGRAARALARAEDSGAPVADAVREVAQQARTDAAALALLRARRAGVLAVGPLGLCFLPAFVLLGVVPAVLGLAGPLLTSL